MRKEEIKKLEEQSKQAFGIGAGEVYTDYRDTWRVFKIMAELVEGYNFLHTLKNEITIFGSARLGRKDKYYKEAEAVARRLAEDGFNIITGGGPGIMEAANKGAYEAGGESGGLNIQLPYEQRINQYVKKSAAFHYFFTRKVMLVSPANGFVFFPGGYGTLDEFFEVVDLMDQKLMFNAPVVLVGRDFWQPVLDFLRESCCGLGSVNVEKINEWPVVDTAEAAYLLLKDVEEVRGSAFDLSPTNFNFQEKIDWKIFKVMAELVEGMEFISRLSRAVTILGTHSITLESRYYDAAYALGERLAARDYSVVTGAKFGTAEAANKGAYEAGGLSYGIGVKFGQNAEVNHYLTDSILFSFPFIRKLVITVPTKALVFFPGGFGTLHYLFEVLTLMQTKKIPQIPVILFDVKFWRPLSDFIEESLIKKYKTIGAEDRRWFTLADTVEEIMAEIDKDENT